MSSGLELNENPRYGRSASFGNFTENAVRFALNYLSRFGIAGVVVYSCWIAIVNYHYWFSWHVLLCTFGYVPLMAESIMLFTGDELWSRQMTRTAKYTVHGIIVIVATIMLTAGDGVVFHYISAGYHLNTAHGITGLVSLVLLLLSIPFGLIVKYWQEVRDHLAGGRAVWFKAIHNLLGILGYAVGIVSLCYAYYTNWFVYYTSYESRMVALVVTIVASAWTLNAAIWSLYNQVKDIVV